MPANTVYVGRGSRWGNPFHVGQQYMPAVLPHEIEQVKNGCMTHFFVEGRPGIPLIRFKDGPLTADDVVSLYRAHILENVGAFEIRGALADRNLACWCALSDPCHADVLLEIANT
jgi:hypothetical protein